MKIMLCLFALILALSLPASAEIAPIIWSESIHNTPKPTTELVNLDDYLIVKSDRTVHLNLTDYSPIKAITLSPDNNRSPYFSKKAFLINIELSDNVKKVIDLPLGTHKFN